MSSSCATKRKRSSNFSKEEELCLLEHIEQYKNVIENKTTNKVSQSEKENAWLRILKEFNSKNIQTSRTLEQVKSKYDNLKTKTRKEVADKKKYIKQTGGGSPINYDLDITTQAVLRIINLKTVLGLENNIDSDSVSNFKESTEPQPCTETEDITHSSSVQYNDTNFQSIFDFHDVSDNQKNTEPDIEVQPRSSKQYDEANLKSVVNLRGIGDNQNTEPDIAVQSSSDGANPKKISKDSTSWSSYTPKKLKLKPNKKLRQIRTDIAWEAKENYYKRKTELLEKTYEEESSMRKRKEDREKEEHEKKMRLMDMEIILKEKQLQHDMF